MITLPDFPLPLIAGDNVDQRILTWQFTLPAGVTITNIRGVTVTQAPQGSAIGAMDSDPASRVLNGPNIGTDNASIWMLFGNCVAGVRYLFLLKFDTSDGIEHPGAFNHIRCVAPG